jgi:hypothetical protein
MARIIGEEGIVIPDLEGYWDWIENVLYQLVPFSGNVFLREPEAVPDVQRRNPRRRMGPLRFELRTSAMSRRRHSQLDHEPS